MNREPVNIDDPQLTAYALGEMSPSERIEFQTKLEVSPVAMKELEAMEDMMGLLSKGLKSEWCREMHQPNLEVLPSIEAGKVIVPAQFNQPRKAFAAMAAAVAAMALVGAAVFTQTGEVKVAEAAVANSLMDPVAPVVLASVSGQEVHVPQLFLAEEIEDMSSLDLVDSLGDLSRPVDASYLDSNVVVPASYQGNGSGGARSSFHQDSTRLDRVDSYLPPVENGVVRFGIETGLIEGRVMNSIASNEGASRIFVRGYVPMDSRASSNQSGPILAGFHPVSISGNPVKDSEADLQILSELQSVQREMQSIVNSLPEGSELRGEFSKLLERNGAAVSELKHEFAR